MRLCSAVCGLCLLSLPLEFTACKKDSLWCSTAYWLTESAGKYGTLVIIVIAGFLYTLRIGSKREKIKTFFRPVIALLIILSVFAFVNEHATKKILKYARPSHLYVISQSGQQVDLVAMYKLETEQRQKFLQGLINNSPALTNSIDKKVLDHWVEEAGYSFPSGHSFNAFLLACILSFSIYHSRYKKIFFVPFVWALFIAVSRVAIGAHSALDVSVGAALGILIAILFLYFDTTKNIFIRKKPAA
ncbi:MAG TPA: phosphatase PAP2 family protein [Bacteroidia bacterium]|jgi:phosphatidylglycerophosphatase B|nr:phosphatase PAP2 family protein [Bacteroidia bacterium]